MEESVFIKSSVQFVIHEDLSVNEEGKFESIFIELVGQNTVLGKVYRIPGTTIRSFMEQYEHIVKSVVVESKSVIIGSDQNIDLFNLDSHS